MTTIGVSAGMFLLVPSRPGPGVSRTKSRVPQNDCSSCSLTSDLLTLE